ncbi:MAG: hypothetical protein HGA51_07575 [Demequinaceae bacterium]|nr:hypothetical protein [Demequinaceae bacterium]
MPWFRRTWVIATAAGVVVVGAAIGTIVALSGGGTPVAAATVSPSTTEASPSASASAEPTVATLLDDGIADDEYPATAPQAGGDYPEALVMEDWVWDRVGPTWTLVSVADFDVSAGTSGPSVIYLASPEGVLFDLAHVNSPGGVAQIVSWLPSERKARIQVLPLGYEGNAGGALVDLRTGAVEDMSFSTDAGRSAIESFLAASGSGAELWSAQDADYLSVRFEWWTRSGGWKRVLPDADIAPWTAVQSGDGSTVAAELYSTDDSGFKSARSGPPGQPVLVVFDVNSGAQKLIRPVYDSAAARWCRLDSVSDEGVPILSCWNDSYDNLQWKTAADGQPLGALDIGATLPMRTLWDAATLDLPDLGLSLVSVANDGQVFEVAVGGKDSSVAVLRAGVDIPYGGLSEFHADAVAEGVVVARATEACAIIDIQNAHGVTLATTQSGSVGCLGYGIGNGYRPVSPYWGEGG